MEMMKSFLPKLKQMLSKQEKNATEVRTFYGSSNPDHTYILEILLAASLFRDFGSQFKIISLHPTRYSINHSLFLELQEAKGRARHSKGSIGKQIDSKPQLNTQKKLVFDVVNEILARKLYLESSFKWWLWSNMPAGEVQRGYQLLGGLCSEIDRLQSVNTNCSLDDVDDRLLNIIWADLTHESTHWTARHDEIPELVLCIEG